MCAAPGIAAPPATPSKQFRVVQTAFLWKLVQFVEWPEARFSSPESPLIVGVLGDDPFGSNLDDIFRGEKIGKRPIQVVRFKRVEDIKVCHILYVSASEAPQLDRALAALAGRSIVTVSDIETFARSGGIVQFAIEDGQTRLYINYDASRAAQIEISSKLLRGAKIVKTSKG